MEQNKIFISHSSKDVLIVKAFVDNILKIGLEINAKRIFCTSVEGQGIKSGKYIPQTIREELKRSCLVFLMISDNYRASEVCQNELGAAWVLLPEDKVIPVIIDSCNYDQIGFININKLALRATDDIALLRMIDENKSILNEGINLSRLNSSIRDFISIQNTNLPNKYKPSNEELCFSILGQFAEISQRILPEYHNELYHTEDRNIIDQVFKDLASKNFKGQLRCILLNGDRDIRKVARLKNGNWLLDNYELKISELWFNINDSTHQEFILINTGALQPFTIDSTGKESYEVGVLKDGTTVSSNEFDNGFTRISGEIFKVDRSESELRYRFNKNVWIMIATRYHNVINDFNNTTKFMSRIDKGEIELSKESVFEFIWNTKLHSIVLKNR